ncbi:MAG: response regulator [Candidatus Daviesbacteria bacterium]|nr:response regulator [Candidatus Daviesbacteria bacterium]
MEDEAPVLNALSNKLTNEGFSVLEARDGEEGLKIALREHPDLILLDNVLPKMDGMSVMHKIREDVWGKKASIIILTNFDVNDPLLSNVVRDQPSYYLVKANNPLEKILEKIQEVLESKKAENTENI